MGRKVLFVHDGPMGVCNEGYFGIHYKNALVDRYLFFGDQVTFLTREEKISPHETTKYSRMDHPAFRFIPFPNFKSLSTRHKKSQAQKIIYSAVEQHDVIITRLPSAAGVIAFRQAKRLNKPVLVEFVACVFDALWNYDWRGKLIAHYKYRQYQRLMKQATHAIYVTEEFLQSRYPTTNGKSIGCSDVEINELDEKVLQKRLQRIEAYNEPLTLATVAAVDVKYKGQADVIEAIALLKKQDVKIKYKIIGQGNPAWLKRKAIKLGVMDDVEFVGPIPHQEVFSMLSGIDVYIQPSYQEGLPRAVIEALSIGCPAIGAKTGGIPELIDKEYIYPPGDVKELVVRLSSMTPAHLKQEATRNFHKAKKYERTHLYEKRECFYLEFLKDNNLQNA